MQGGGTLSRMDIVIFVLVSLVAWLLTGSILIGLLVGLVVAIIAGGGRRYYTRV